MKKIEAKIIADSKDSRGNRIITYLLTYPRFIHSELMTHRMFSRNSASSRAIPFEKMVQMVKEDPFIPIAWQKDHSGMQGTEYFTDKSEIDILKDNWMTAKDRAVTMAKELHLNGLTKQLCNRLLEPFMWHTVLVTATEFDNFYELRCPRYQHQNGKIFKSWKDLVSNAFKSGASRDWVDGLEETSQLERIKISTSGAEIHMQALAEAMYDAYNESTPKELKSGEWHIPFGDTLDFDRLFDAVNGTDWFEEFYHNPEIFKVKIATARCARLSYMTFDGEIDYEKDIELHDKLLISKHASPFEHCCRAMTDLEYHTFIKGKIEEDESKNNPDIYGWSDNLRGFISYRHLIENM